MSMMNSGRLRRGRMTASMCALVRIGAAAPVAVMTMSLRAEHRVELVPRRGARAADRFRRPRRVRHRPADDRHVLHALRLHVQRGQLAHLAGADDERRCGRLRSPKILRASDDGGEADRHRARAEAGFRAHALADGERRVEQPVEHRADGLRVGGAPCARPSPGRESAARRRPASRGRRRRGTDGAPRRGPSTS